MEGSLCSVSGFYLQFSFAFLIIIIIIIVIIIIIIIKAGFTLRDNLR